MAPPPEPADDRPVFAAGRAADVYDQGDGTVLRRYRADIDCRGEGRAMRWLAEQGIPVPVHHAEGRDLVMDLVPGPTMLEDLEAKPWRMVAHARLLARLQREINALDAPDWFPTDDGVTPGSAVVHVDLHPMNVLFGPDGPVVIDWTNAARGDPDFDAAMTYVLGATVERTNLLERVGTPTFMGCFALARGRRVIRRRLHAATEYRLRDPNVTDAEREALERLRDRAA